MRLKRLDPYQKKKKVKGLCVERRCFKKAKKRNNKCSMHLSRDYKKKHPIKYLFNIKKQRAKERGISWELSLEGFKKWVIENEYMEKRGKNAGDLTIDRINPEKGYCLENIQPLTLRENVTRRWVQFSQGVKTEKIFKDRGQKGFEDLPF